MAVPNLDQIRDLVKDLSPRDKLLLIDDLVHQLLEGSPPESSKPPHRSLWGALAHLGPAPSEEQIDEARREAWSNFPREDI